MKFVAEKAMLSYDGGKTWVPFPIVSGSTVEVVCADTIPEDTPADRVTFKMTFGEFDPVVFGPGPLLEERRYLVALVQRRKKAQWKNEPKRKGPKPR